MSSAGHKRRRLCHSASPESAAAAAAAAASYRAMHAALSKSLADAAAAVTLAARAQPAQSVDAALAIASASGSIATASALAHSLRAAANVSGGGDAGDAQPDAHCALPAPGASARGGRGCVHILDLPDAALERVFDFLDCHYHGPCSPRATRSVPCKPALLTFALSCRRLSELFRKSYIKTLCFSVALRFARDASIYYEGVSGALGRFSAARSLTVIGSDCFSEKLLALRDDEFGIRCKYHPLSDSHSIVDYRLAAGTRKAIPVAIAGGLIGVNITKIDFEGSGHGSVPVRWVCKDDFDLGSIWKWKDEQYRWLDILPNVTSAVFQDFQTLCHAQRICGSRASLKTVSLSFSGRGSPNDSSALLELAQFDNIETLLILDMSFIRYNDDFDLPAVVNVLPKLRSLGIRLGYESMGELEGPVLKHVLREPASPMDRLLQITVHSSDWRSELEERLEEESEALAHENRPSPREVRAQCQGAKAFQTFRAAVVGEFDSQWLVTEIFEDSILGYIYSDEIAVVLNYRSE